MITTSRRMEKARTEKRKLLPFIRRCNIQRKNGEATDQRSTPAEVARKARPWASLND